jgi:hypothetical protein
MLYGLILPVIQEPLIKLPEQNKFIECYLKEQSVIPQNTKFFHVKSFTPLFLVLLLAIPLAGKAIDSIYIRSPAVNDRSRAMLNVEAKIFSTSAIDTVRVSVGGQTALLTRYSQGEYFGTITFTGMAEGPLQLVVLAKDVTGDTLSATRTFIYDKAPVVTVESPLREASYQSKVHIKATVKDPGHDNCEGVVSTEDGFSISFMNSIDTLVDPNPGKVVGAFDLNFYGIDSINTKDSYPPGAIIPLYNDKSSYLTPVNVDTGEILDVDSTRILRAVLLYENPLSFRIYNTLTSASSFINLDRAHIPANSFLVGGLCKGGAFSVHNNHTYKLNPQLYLWQGDSLINITTPLKITCLETDIKSAGNTLMWTTGTGKTAITDLSTLKTTFTDIPEITHGKDLSRDGETIVYSAGPNDNYAIYSYSVSTHVITQITTSESNIAPFIDGNNIAYLKNDGANYSTYLNDGTTDYNLGLASIYFNVYRLFDGYIAFERLDSFDHSQEEFWLRTPAKVLRKITSFLFLSGSFDKLGADGRLIFMNYTEGSIRMRYYADSVTANVPISGTSGKTYFEHDSFYLALGGTLYAYHIPSVVLPPQITAITPDSAVTGNTVTIKGLHLANASAVSFGGTIAASYTIVSDSVITAVVGAGSSGDISVTTPVGTAAFSGFYFVFHLPEAFFTITNTNATCKGGKDGSITISVPTHSGYIVDISGPSVNKSFSFVNKAVLKNLAAGTYNICINSLYPTGYQRCVTSVIQEPKPLSAYIAVNQDDRKVTLSLTGAVLYHIKLNDTEITTEESQITLDLKKGLNKIAVSTDKLCQGIITKDITIGANLVAYPNPFQQTIHLNIGNETVQKAVITVYNASGKIVYTHGYNNQSGVITIDLPDMSDGLYMLKLAADNQETIFKLLKK